MKNTYNKNSGAYRNFFGIFGTILLVERVDLRPIEGFVASKYFRIYKRLRISPGR